MKDIGNTVTQQRFVKRKITTKQPKKAAKKTKHAASQVLPIDQDLIPWIPLFFEIRQAIQGMDEEESEIQLYKTVWIIDENPPRLMSGKITKKIKPSDCLEYEVEIDKHCRNSEFDNTWRYYYPSWMVFKKKKRGQRCVSTFEEKTATISQRNIISARNIMIMRAVP